MQLTRIASLFCASVSTENDLPAKVRANARRYRHHAEASGTLDCSVAMTVEEARDSFEHLVRLHQERWQARGEPGVLSDPRVLAHHHEAIPCLLKAGLLTLFRLTLNGE